VPTSLRPLTLKHTRASRKGAAAEEVTDEVKREIISRLAGDRDSHGLPSHVLSTLRQLSLGVLEQMDMEHASTPKATSQVRSPTSCRHSSSNPLVSTPLLGSRRTT
jgi:hypothetical protein